MQAGNATLFESIGGVRGTLVAAGLGQPLARGFVAGTCALGICYIGGMPNTAFREDGTMKPFKPLSMDADATNAHFLLVPLTVGLAAFLFT